MIELIPAIDIIEGQCVRLSKGDYDTKKVYGKPLDMALRFEDWASNGCTSWTWTEPRANMW